MKKTLTILLIFISALVFVPFLGSASQTNSQIEIANNVNAATLASIDTINEQEDIEEKIEDEVIEIPEVTVLANGASISYGEGGTVTLEANSTGYSIVSYSGNPITLNIVNASYTITRIEDEALKNCISLTSVTIPDTVTYIGNKAFYGCTKLATINLPTSINAVGEFAFFGTPWLTTTRENSVGKLVIVNNVLVDGKKASGDVVIPSKVTKIAVGAFKYNTTMTSVTMTTVAQIPYQAFYECNALTSASLNGVTKIEERAFYNCSSLVSILEVVGNLNAIGNSAFAKCSSLTTLNITESSAFEVVGEKAFESCTSLASFSFSQYIKTIGHAAFYKCTALTTITFKNETSTLTKLGESAFRGCTKLATVTNLPSVTIEPGAFADTQYVA